MKDINIKFIPHDQHRPECSGSIGDYWETDDSIEFRITTFPGKPFYSYACLLHERWEKLRNNQLGITDEEVEEFDRNHPHDEYEPGELVNAPYHQTHMEADAIERLAIIFFGEDFTRYTESVDDLYK